MHPQSYNLSFTAATLRVREMVTLADLVASEGSVERAVEMAVERNVFQLGNVKSSKRFVAEMKRRLLQLPEDVYLELPQMKDEEQRQICYVATCLSYPIFQNFLEYINTEKLPLLDLSLTEEDIQSFFYREEDMYEELDRVSDHSKKKIRQVMLNIFTEVGILDSQQPRCIYRLIAEPRVESIIQQYFPEVKRFLLAY